MADMVQAALVAAKESGDETRRDTAQQLLDYYHGLFDAGSDGASGFGYFRTLLSMMFPGKYDKMYPFASYQNIIKQITDKRAMVFKTGVTFSVADDDKRTQWITDNITPDLHNQILATCDSYKTLLGTMLIRVNWRDNAIQWDLVAPSVIIVVQDELDPTKAQAIITEYNYKDTTNATKRFFKVWKKEVFWEEDENGVYTIPPEPNPYGRLPYTTIRDEMAIDRFFIDLDMNLLNAQNITNTLKTEIQYLAAYCMPTVILKNWNGSMSPSVGPSEVLSFDMLDPQATAGMEYVSPPMQIAELRSELDAHNADTMRSYGITPHQQTGQVKSGVALRLENYDLLERRQDQLGLWRAALNDLLSLSITVWEAHTGQRAPVAAGDVSINFGEIGFPESQKEKLDNYQKELDLHITSPSRILMAEDPDLGKDQALAIVQANITETKSAQQQSLLKQILGNGNNE